MVLPVTNSLPVHGHLTGSIADPKSKRAIVIKLPDEIVHALIARRESSPNDPPLDINFGENPGIHIGNSFFPTEFTREQRTHEIFTLTSNKTQAPLRHYASVEGKILVKRVLDDKISSKVKRSTEVSQQQAKARPVKIIDTPPTQSKGTSKSTKKKKPPPTRSAPLHVRNEGLHSNGSTSTPSTRLSPNPPPAPTPKVATNEAQALMRYRLVHFLAVAPRASADVIQTIGGSGKTDATTRSHISTLLSQVAIEDPPPKRSEQNPPPRLWRLKAESWFDVRPHEYPSLKDEERKRIESQAQRVFKSMSIPDTDPRWEHVKYRFSPSTSITYTDGRAQQASAREPSPLPPVNSRRKPPGSQKSSLHARSTGSLPDRPPSSSTAKLSGKEHPAPKSERTKAVPLARQADSGVHLQADITKSSAIDRTNRKRERDQELEDDLLRFSETKKRKSSDDDAASSPKTTNKATNGSRANTLTPTSSKRHSQSVAPSASTRTPRVNGSISSKRRKSPIYTSTSESENEPVVKKELSTNGSTPHRPPKRTPSPLPSNGRPKSLPYVMPKIAFGGTLPKDHASLRKRYNAIYPSYIAVYQKRVEQRTAIEKMLEDSPPAEEGEVEEGLTVGSDIEMMDASDLERLNADLFKLESELSRINSALQSAPG